MSSLEPGKKLFDFVPKRQQLTIAAVTILSKQRRNQFPSTKAIRASKSYVSPRIGDELTYI